MSIIPRGNSFQVRIDRGGRKVVIGSFSAKKYGGKREAYKAAKKAEADALSSAIGTSRETVAEFADRWLTDFNEVDERGRPRWKPRTIEMHGLATRTFCAAEAVDGRLFGPMKLCDVTKPLIRPWALSASHTYMRAVRAMFNDARIDGQMIDNPCSALRRSKPKGREDIDVLTYAEVERLCEIALAVTTDGFGPTLAAMIATAAWTGVRPGELVALRSEDVRLDQYELDIHRQYVDDQGFTLPKTGKTRLGIVLPPRAAEYIAAIPGRFGRQFVFEAATPTRSDPQFGPVIGKAARHYRWDQVRKQAGRLAVATGGTIDAAGFDWYELRHFGATWLYETMGLTEAEVAWQLGHKDTTQVERLYTHPSDEWRRDSIKRKLGLGNRPRRDDDDDEGLAVVSVGNPG